VISLLVIDEGPNKLVREKALKHLQELCLKSIKELRDIPELEEPTYDQKAWFVRRMKGSKKSWEVYDQ
jgi:hypothetical protein